MERLLTLLISMTLMFSGCGAPESPQNPENNTYISNESSFAVHYIDVGQADASLVLCDGESMLIDGGNADDSSLIAAYLKKLDIDYLDYVICTHAHEDHVGGLSGALSVADAGMVYAPHTEADTKVYKNFKNKVSALSLDITHPNFGDTFSLGSSTVQVLGPVYEDPDEVNNTSIVLKVIYGSTSFLFTGDAETDEENDIINEGFDLSADVLKVGHHGSSSSTSYRFLREVMPEYAVISCGKGNSYGHPHDEILSRLKDAEAEIMRTDLLGDIIITSDGENINVTSGRGSGIATAPEKNTETPKTPATSAVEYTGNKNSKKFHYPTCSSASEIKEINKTIFSSRDEAINSGYSPCKSCNP